MMKDIRTLLKMDFREMSVEERCAAIDDQLKNYRFHRNWLENHKQFDGRSSECRFHREAMRASWERIAEWMHQLGLETEPMPKI